MKCVRCNASSLVYLEVMYLLSYTIHYFNFGLNKAPTCLFEGVHVTVYVTAYVTTYVIAYVYLSDLVNAHASGSLLVVDLLYHLDLCVVVTRS